MYIFILFISHCVSLIVILTCVLCRRRCFFSPPIFVFVGLPLKCTCVICWLLCYFEEQFYMLFTVVQFMYVSYLSKTSVVFPDDVCLCIFFVKNFHFVPLKDIKPRDLLTLIVHITDYANFSLVKKIYQ